MKLINFEFLPLHEGANSCKDKEFFKQYSFISKNSIILLEVADFAGCLRVLKDLREKGQGMLKKALLGKEMVEKEGTYCGCGY